MGSSVGSSVEIRLETGWDRLFVPGVSSRTQIESWKIMSSLPVGSGYKFRLMRSSTGSRRTTTRRMRGKRSRPFLFLNFSNRKKLKK